MDRHHRSAWARLPAALLLIPLAGAGAAAGAGIQFHGAAGGETPGGSGVSISIAAPSGLAPGDVLVAGFFTGDHASQLTWDAGEWTLLDQTQDQTAVASGYNSWWLYKTAGASEPLSYTFDLPFAGGNGGYGAIVAYGGVDPSRPLRSHQALTITGSPWVAPAAFVQPGDWIGFGFAVDNPPGPDSWTAPPGAIDRLAQAQLALFDFGPASSTQAGPFSAISLGTPDGGYSGTAEVFVLVPAVPVLPDGGVPLPDGGLKVGCGCRSGAGPTAWLAAALLALVLPFVRRPGRKPLRRRAPRVS